jgi:hypothetical protein
MNCLAALSPTLQPQLAVELKPLSQTTQIPNASRQGGQDAAKSSWHPGGARALNSLPEQVLSGYRKTVTEYFLELAPLCISPRGWGEIQRGAR